MDRKLLYILLYLLFPALLQAQDLPSTYPSHYFSFTPADSTHYPAIYPDQETRDSISADFRNAYKAAKAIEQYALKKQNISFLKRINEEHKKWLLTLTNGSEIKIGPSPGSNTVDYNFEHYYPSVGIVVFRAQWYEGNNYVLVSRKDGNKTQAYGPPVFSPTKKLFLSYNGVEVSDYSNTGIQLFKITDTGMTKLIEFDTELIPSKVQWVDKQTFKLEIYEAKLRKRKGIERNYRHYRAGIHTTEP